MFQKKNLICLLLYVVSFYGFAQDNLPLGTKTLYSPKQTKFSPAPAGYIPVYINYVGRHGARHLTKDVKLSYAYKTLFFADSLNLLTAAGKELKQMILNLGKEEAGKTASISKIGTDELKGIAKRIYASNKDILSSEPPILVSTTKKGRTQESAEAFLEGLKASNANSVSSVRFKYADDDNLRFYDFSKAYDEFKENGNWLISYQKLVKQQNLESIANRFAAKLFKPAYISKITVKDKIKLADDVYGFYTIIAAVKLELEQVGLSNKDLNFKSFFSINDLLALAKLGDAEDFLTKGPGMDKNGIQVRIAAPLLADFIKTTDAFIESRPIVADLRFAHAETIAPFAAIMDIKGASEPAKNILNFASIWQAEQVIPFSSNIQWLVYYNKSKGDYLVKFLLNEKEVAINGLKSNFFPYYSWNEVKKYYLSKLKLLNLNLQDDMHNYLLNLR